MPTTRECVHLVTRGHFNHMTKTAVVTPFEPPHSKTPFARKGYRSMFYRSAVTADGSFTLLNRDFRLFRSCDLSPMIFNTNSTRMPSRYTGCSNMKVLRQDFRNLSSYTYTQTYIQTERQTDRQDRNYIPRHFAGCQ